MELQQAEFSAEKSGYTATRHQRGGAGTDDVTQTVMGGKSWITALHRLDRGSAVQGPRGDARADRALPTLLRLSDTVCGLQSR